MWFASVSVSVIVSVNRLLISFAWICKAFGEHPCGCVRVYRMALRAAAAAAAVSVAASANCYCFANKIRSITCCCCCCCHYILYPFCYLQLMLLAGMCVPNGKSCVGNKAAGQSNHKCEPAKLLWFQEKKWRGGLGILRKFSWIYSLRDWLPAWLIAWATHAWRTDVNAKFSTALPLKLQIKAAKA